MEKSLKLSEKLFCLAVNPKKGGIFLNASSALGMTLTGTVFMELLNKDLITIQNKAVHLQKVAIQNDGIHEFFLNPIRRREKDRKIRMWILIFNVKNRRIQKLFIRDLVRKGVLRTEERRILFVPYEKVFLMDRALVDSIRKEVEEAALGIGNPTDESLLLAVMVAKTNLLTQIIPDRQRRKEAVANLKKLPESDISKAVREAIQMVHTAIVYTAS
ncbi:MAG: GPP34 family phosphoprotein [Prolixibacteraceae bacterium]